MRINGKQTVTKSPSLWWSRSRYEHSHPSAELTSIQCNTDSLFTSIFFFCQ